eukprot:2416664-Rhodomonas_salina.1
MEFQAGLARTALSAARYCSALRASASRKESPSSHARVNSRKNSVLLSACHATPSGRRSGWLGEAA